MKQRWLVSLLVLPVLMTAARLVPVFAQAAQAPSPTARVDKTTAPAKAWKLPRTPDGQPDLQGFWTNSTYTSLERPDGVTKTYYTPAEAEAAIKLAIQREGAQTVAPAYA